MVRNRPAFTLLELLLGVTVTALVGLSAVTIGGTLSTRYQKGEDYYASLQTARVALGRVQSLFRSAQLVIQVSPTQVMLWCEGAGGDGQINPSELVLLTCSDGQVRQTQTVYGSDAASQMIRALFDQPVSLGGVLGDPSAWANTVTNGLHSSSRAVASGVTGLSITTDAEAPMTRMVTITVTGGEGAAAFALRSGVCLRADRTDCVATVAGAYALVSP